MSSYHSCTLISYTFKTVDDIDSEGGQSFSSWLKRKLGTESELARTSATIASAYAILEIAVNVLGVGTGFAKINMTKVTLAQIKESIEIIPGKFDKNLERPLKLAIDRFRAALNMISHENQKRAYETFKDVIDNTSQVFYYMETKDMTLTDLEACVQAIQLLIFSNIARFSYDESTGTFLPFLTLPMQDKAMIATEIMDIVDRCLKNRSRVKKGNLLSGRSGHQAKVQDTLDTILRVTYFYISEGKGWTKSTTKFDLKDNTVNIRVMPKYVPMGEEDKKTLIIGVYTQKMRKCQRISIWRTEDMIYISGYGNYSKQISSETEIAEFSINHFLVLTSTEGAAQLQGGSLGQYCYDPVTGTYIQTNTEGGHEKYQPVYIYPVDDEWRVGPTPGKKSGWMYNPTKSKSLPVVGWMYADETWHADTSLVISPGPLTLCDSLTVFASGPTAEKQPASLGEFSRTEMWWNGKPVFRNSHGQLLHQSNNQGWIVGVKLGKVLLAGSMAHHCPGSEKKWTFWDGTNDIPASVKIECKVHV